MSNVLDITSPEQFNKSVATGLVVVKVSTSTCGPCKMMGPVFEKISEDSFENNYSFLSVVADQSVDLSNMAKGLGVLTVPTFFVYENGSVINQFSGAFPLKTLVEKLKLN